MFHRYTLRTTDVDGARRFYAELLDLDLPDGDADGPLGVWPLHETTRARGVPSHWLGQIGVPDTEAAWEDLLAAGGRRLAPPMSGADGVRFATLVDPFGVPMALRDATGPTPPSPVAWHHLHVRDADAAWALYADRFGWQPRDTFDVPDLDGPLRTFAWADGPAVAAVANTARWPGVHTAWLFHFAVDDVPAAVERVRALGGLALEPFTHPDGRVVAACDDPQGAAFGLVGA